MIQFNEKYQRLCDAIGAGEKVRIMIFGLGSVGTYLLDYLVSLADEQLEIIVAGRNPEKMQLDVNIVRTAATIRGQLRSEIHMVQCDLNDVDSIAGVLKQYEPHILVNSSRVYAGLKYGSISWTNLRAYGIWSPLAIKYARNIMLAYAKADCKAISINTSYSDAVIPWLKSAGLCYFDFGSGNLNHLIPRMKFYLAQKYAIENLNEIDMTIAMSHFHDVVISKEGQSEGQNLLIDARFRGEQLAFEQDELLAACSIPMPTDQKRNMMNASSNFAIIKALLGSLREKKVCKVHSPGVQGMIGGYPFVLDGVIAQGYIDESIFGLDDMKHANMESIYKDGIENVTDGCLVYTDELLSKVCNRFGVELPKRVALSDVDAVAERLINEIIKPALV